MTPLQATLFDPAILVHVVSAVVALVLGALVIAGRKGTPTHRLAGRAWVAAMAVAAGSSFLIGARIFPLHTPLGDFGPIHLLSAFTLAMLVRAIAAIRRGDVGLHRRAMTRAFAGLAIAAAFTLVPGRALNAWVLALVA